MPVQCLTMFDEFQCHTLELATVGPAHSWEFTKKCSFRFAVNCLPNLYLLYPSVCYYRRAFTVSSFPRQRTSFVLVGGALNFLNPSFANERLGVWEHTGMTLRGARLTVRD